MYYKVAFIGDSYVGKTTLAKSLVGVFSHTKMTVGVNVLSLQFNDLKVVIFDLGGQRRFRFLTPLVLKGSRIVCYIFDVTRPSTLYSLESFSNYASLTTRHAILVGNKVDLGLKVTRDEVERVAKRLGVRRVFYTSAIKGCGVNELKTYIVESLQREERN